MGKREKKLGKNIEAGAKRVKGILSQAQRSVFGATAQYTMLKNFSTNASVRNKLFVALGKEYKALDSKINDWVKSEVDVTGSDWWNYAKADLPKGEVAGTFGAFSEKHIAEIIGYINPSTVNTQIAMNAQIAGSLTNNIRVIRAAVATTLAEGAVEGLTNREMSKRMQAKVLKASGEFKFIDKAGRSWKADSYFGMLNRTLHAEAARRTYITTATTELGYDLYTIAGGVTGSSAGKSGDPCDDWVGRPISMTGETPGYPTYDDAKAAGVFHPNCVHYVRALLPREVEPAEKAYEARGRNI